MKWIIFIVAMHDVHLAGFDLNLLLVLSALVAEENVTRAGKRVGISQSAMSHALARLRATLDDPVLVRAQGRMVATHRARAMATKVDAALAMLGHALHDDVRFDPRKVRRTFTLAMSDYTELVLLPPLLERLRNEAPGIDLWVLSAEADYPERLADGRVDLVVAPMRDRRSGIEDEVLFEDRFVCAMREGHPLADARMTIARFTEASHVLVAPSGQRGSYTDDALATLGLTRRVMLGVPHFLIVPHILRSSDLIATLAERVANAFAAPHGLAFTKTPVDVPGFSISQIWHTRSGSDAGHVWLRRMLREVSSASATTLTLRRKTRQQR